MVYVKQERKISQMLSHVTKMEHAESLSLVEEWVNETEKERESTRWKEFYVWDKYLFQRNFNCISLKALMVYKNKHMF